MSELKTEPRASRSRGAAGTSRPYVLPFEHLGRGDVDVAGGKGANLGEMTRAGLPVPPGFVVTVHAYRRVLDAARLTPVIADELARCRDGSPEALRAAAERIRSLLLDIPLAGDVRAAIVEAYTGLGEHGRAPVAVRSSGTAEDTARYSFAGMFESFLNVRGEEDLLRRVRECWASGFTERVLYYRQRQHVEGSPAVAVVVQRMVQSEKAGVLFTVDPATGADTLVIEGAFGLGEVVVAGQVTPDRYVVDKASRAVVSRTVGHKEFMLVRDATGSNRRVPLDDERADAPVLDEDELGRLTDLALRLEEHYRRPQDAEWAVEGSDLWLVQSRPVTTVERSASGVVDEGVSSAADDGERTVLLRGMGAGPGIGIGRVRVLLGPEQGDLLTEGEVLVAPNTTPDWVPVMRRAVAVVTDVGGMTSHAAIVSRELGIPCVVGTRTGTSVLRPGTEVTVDGTRGEVLSGRTVPVRSVAASARGAPGAPETTATRLYVNLGEPSRAVAVAAMPVDGVGLLRAEFMVVEALGGKHPRLLLEEGHGDDFVDRMAEGLGTIVGAFHPRPVIYRAMDFRSNEFRGLEGGDRFEPDEANPMIGYRGCYRYAAEPDLFALELRALARVRSSFPGLHLMLPFVRTGRDFAECRRIIDESPLADDPRLELWVMAEVPSVIAWLPEYVRMGATGVSIGSNDLTQLMLGVDRDSEIVAPLFDERDRAVLWAVESIVRACGELGVTCSICGQAPSVHPEYVDRLVEWGIDSVSVSPDAVERTRTNIARAEKRILLRAARAARAPSASERGRTSAGPD